MLCLGEEGREMYRKYQKCEEPNKNGKNRKYNIKLDLSRICCGVVGLIYLVQVMEQEQILVNIITLILPRSRTGTVWFYTSTSNKRAA